jgi:hypothetical protein
MNVHQRLSALGLAVPELLLPKPEIDLSKWAVIACDQFTQDRSYWEAVRSAVGDAPSTLNLIYPEVYLDDPDRAERIASIHGTMSRYLADPAVCPVSGVFAPPSRACMYVERKTAGNPVPRRGILVALDLECYDWKTGAASLIRPTEGTLPERIPARMEIRRGAALELPHILVLIDDEENTLIPGLGVRAQDRSGGKGAYDTKLMFDSGRASGWLLDGEADWDRLAAGLETLARRTAKEYGTEGGAFLYAVGDGNHSLAAAKAVWEEYKRVHGGLTDHPARWALAEIENLYDPALAFEPIHRILFNTPIGDIQQVLTKLPGYRCRRLDASGSGSAAALAALIQDESSGMLRFGLAAEDGHFLVEADPVPLAVDALQPLLDAYTADHPGVTVDYIHGAAELFRLAGSAVDKSAGTGQTAGPVTGILLPPFRKQGLFTTVARRGPLPRKSFSMGNAEEKRFYLECRKLFG